MKKILTAALIWAVLGSAEAYKVGICQVAQIEALDKNVEGIKDKCKDAEIRVEVCQCSASTAAQIIQKFANGWADVIVTVGTLPTQVAQKTAKGGRAKIVFTAVTDPSPFSGPNVTGVSDFVAIEPQLAIIKQIQPKLKKLAYIYSAGEANSANIRSELREAAKKLDIELVEICVQKPSDVPQAASAAAHKAEAVYVSNDNTVLSHLPLVAKEADKRKIPVYVSDTDEVTNGCLAALGPDQFSLGQQVGRMIERVQNSEAVGDIPVEYPKSTELVINLAVAKKLGIDVPKEVRSKAARLIGPE